MDAGLLKLEKHTPAGNNESNSQFEPLHQVTNAQDLDDDDMEEWNGFGETDSNDL